MDLRCQRGVATFTDFDGQLTVYSYDNLGPVGLQEYFANQTAFNSSTASAAVQHVYGPYTAQGQNDQVIDSATGTTNLDYDAQGQLVTAGSPSGTINYTYDALGELASMSTGQSAVQYAYDPRGLLSSVTSTMQFGVTLTGPQTTTYAYDAVGNLASENLPNGVLSTYAYDPMNRVQSLEERNASAQLLDGYYYERDGAGNITTVLDGAPVAQIQQDIAAGNTTSLDRTTYQYDALDRLFAEGYYQPGATSPTETIQHQYDLVGNELSTTTTLSNGTRQQSIFQYDARNELTHEVFSQNGTTLDEILYGYDANGAQISRTSTSETDTDRYNVRQQLVEATIQKTQNGQPVTIDAGYTYDYAGTRASQTVTTTTPTGTTVDTRLLLVDQQSPYGFPQVVEERTPGGVALVTYVQGLHPISQTRSGIESFYLYDAHSGVRALTNAQGSITDTYQYDGYGNLIASTGSTINNVLYRGELFDPTLQEYYLRARLYDPSTGSFTSMDPWSGDPSKPITLNKYLYGNANPVEFRDPTGRESMGELMVVMGITMLLATMEAASKKEQSDTVLAEWLAKLNADMMIVNWFTTMDAERPARPSAPFTFMYMVALIDNGFTVAEQQKMGFNVQNQLNHMMKLATRAGLTLIAAGLLRHWFPLIRIKANGYPDFSPFLLPGNSSVSIPYLGSYGKDFLLCDIIRGIPRGPLQTWHHHEVVGLMYCLPAPDHRIPHTGGVFHYEIATGIADYPLW